MKTQPKQLAPMAFVADIGRSIAFHEHMSFALDDTFTPSNYRQTIVGVAVVGDCRIDNRQSYRVITLT